MPIGDHAGLARSGLASTTSVALGAQEIRKAKPLPSARTEPAETSGLVQTAVGREPKVELQPVVPGR